jgi:hypothetical protein
LDDSANVLRVIRVFASNAKDFSSNECLLLLKAYISSFVGHDSTEQDPWSDELLLWASELSIENVTALVEKFCEQLSLRLYVKLVLTLASSNVSY